MPLMNASRFDALVVRLAHALPRRRVLSASAAVLAVGLAHPEYARACKKVGKKCDKNKNCCDGARCKGDRKDKKGKCRCKNSHTTCNTSCCSGSEECVGGACLTPPGGCPPGADSCGTGVDVPCAGGGTCECGQTTEGATVCGDVTTSGALCGQCDSSADCASFGPGAFCLVTGSVNCCGPGAQNVCRLPCET